MKVFNPLGTALSFPLYVANGSGKIIEGGEVVQQSIGQIIGTPQGSLPCSPYLGCRLAWLLFEPNDTIAGGLGKTYIREALGQQERRIVVTTITYTSEGTTINFNINYQIKATGEVRSLVYPFTREIVR